MGGYLGKSVGGFTSVTEKRQTFNITTTTTQLTGLSYTPTKEEVHVNGIRYVRDVDYTANDGLTITLTNPLLNGDTAIVKSFPSFDVADTVSASNGGTFAGNVQMSGNSTVGGTLVASSRLQVGDSSITQGYPQANFGYVADFQAATGSQTFISIAEPSASSLGDNGTVIGEDASDTYITQRGNKNIKLGTQDLNRLIIDGSGRVTMPYQPAFRAYIATNVSSQISTGTITKTPYDTTSVNTGNHYDTTNYKFVAPVAGNYFFSISQNGMGRQIVYFYKNGSQYHAGEFLQDSGGNWEHCTISAVIPLSANDYVEPYVRVNSSLTVHAWNGASAVWDSFSGFLIG